MRRLPDSICHYLYALMLVDRSPAYFLVETDGCLVSWGGNVEKYGITTLQKGKPVGELIPFLEGLFPLDGPPLFIPYLQMAPDLYVDLHLFASDEGDYALLLDTTADAIHRQQLQQKANDLSLIRDEQLRRSNRY